MPAFLAPQLVGGRSYLAPAEPSASGTTLVYADLAATYSVRALVSSDLVADSTVRALVGANLAATYAIAISSGLPMSFTPSAARTVTVSAGLKPFTAGELWNMTDPKKPRSSKDSDSTVDYSFNWTPWLLDSADTIASHEIVLTEGLVNEGSSLAGTSVTVFVSDGNPAKRASLTCRITTASTPPRVEDRTIYLDIEAA